MNNRRWYPVSRLAPEQIKVLKHSMDPSMTVLLPGVETATAYGCKLVSYHRGGEDQSRVDLDLPVALVKWWAGIQKNERDNFRFKSFMVELLLAHLFDNGLDGSDYAEALFTFFSYIVRTRLGERIVFSDYYDPSKLVAGDSMPIQIFDPVNPDNNIAARYSAADRDAIVDAAEDALDAIAFARRATTKGVAVAQWQTILGTGFKGVA